MAGCRPEAGTPCPPSSTPGGGCGVATEPALSEGGSVESDNPSEQPAPKPQGPDSETPSEQATLFSDILGKVLGKIEPAYIKNNTAIATSRMHGHGSDAHCHTRALGRLSHPCCICHKPECSQVFRDAH